MHQNKLFIKSYCLILGLCLLTAGCQKEGVYKPGKKISKIFTTYESGEKRLYQTWNWDGDLLKSISFFDGSSEMRFQYNGKQLSAIYELGGTNQYYLFHYDKKGKRLDSLDVYKDISSGNVKVRHVAHYDFSYNEEGLISGYKEEVYAFGIWKEGNDALRMVLQCAIPGLPDIAAQKLAKPRTQRKGDEEIWDRISVSFTYQGENVTECHILTNDILEENYTFTYTDYLNPSYKLFQSTSFSSSGLYSKNLVKTCHYENLSSSDPTVNYYEDMEYQYKIEDNYPVKTTCNASIHDYYHPEYTQSFTHVNYYEYYQ
jgi:hypothetical protein